MMLLMAAENIELSVWVLCFVLLQVMLGSYRDMCYYCNLSVRRNSVIFHHTVCVIELC